MTELFENIPEATRKQTDFWINMALMQNSPIDALKMISEYRNSCSTEEEMNYVDFVFNVRMEQLKNESSSN